MAILEAGTPAPQFKMHVTPDQVLSSDELLGKALRARVLSGRLQPVCGDQMALYNQILSEFPAARQSLFGVSVDGVWCHQASRRHATCISRCFRTSNPRAAWRAHSVRIAKRRRVRARAVRRRRKGTIAWSYCSPIAVNPVADGILDALDAMDGRTTS
jgi:hypothetical protein